MAESIIADLKKAGSDNIDSLMNLLQGYKIKEQETSREIKKMKQLIVLKDDELVGLDQDINQLTHYLGTAKGKLEDDIQGLLNILEENKRIIRKQDKHIVDLQQRNEVSQTSIVETNLEAARKDKEKAVIQLKLKELEGKRNTLNESIFNIEKKIVSYRNTYDEQFKNA
jgi:chromosome segregation ATPase